MSIAWTDYENGDSLLDIRTAENAFNNSVVTDVNKNTTDIASIVAVDVISDAAIAQNAADIVLLDGRVTVNEADIVLLQAIPDSARLNPVAVAPTHVEGQFYYDANEGTFNVQGPYPGIEVAVGHGEHLHVVNNSGGPLLAGTPVRISGTAGGIPQIVKAQANTFENSRVAGIVIIDIADGVESAIAVTGVVKGLDTSILTPSVPYYLSATIPGGLTTTAPSIRTVVGGVLVADALDGRFKLDLINNQVTPSVLGLMSGQVTPLYNVSAVVQDVINYTTSTEVVTTVNTTTGEITLPVDGTYRVHFTSAISFPTSTSTRNVVLEFYDVTGTAIHFSYVKNIPRDATEDSLSFSWVIDEIAGNVHKIRISSNVAIDVTFENISFDIESISIT